MTQENAVLIDGFLEIPKQNEEVKVDFEANSTGKLILIFGFFSHYKNQQVT